MYNLKELGPDFLAQYISETKDLSGPNTEPRPDPFKEEITALNFESFMGNQITTYAEETIEDENNSEPEEEEEKKEDDGEKENQQESIHGDNSMSIIAETKGREMNQRITTTCTCNRKNLICS